MDRYPFPLALAYTLWFMTLPRVTAASITGRLKIPGWLTKIILAACDPLQDRPQLFDGPASAVVEYLDGMPRLALYAHFLIAGDDRIKRSLWSYITEWRLVEPVTSGNDLRKRDISPGPNYKRILDSLRAAWLDGEVTSSKEEIILLEKLLNE